MDSLILASVTAFWLGCLTSISPCPLATNIVAISYIGNRVGSAKKIFLSGLLYTGGRMFTYSLLGMLIVSSILAIPEVSMFLQHYMNKILGPILILAGMFLLEFVTLNISGSGISGRLQELVKKNGIAGSAILGILFAVSFCPVSAAIFFGSLIPISIKHGSGILLPSLYGAGTALPVLVLTFMLSWSTHLIGRAFDRLRQIEIWARRITGVIFIGVGIYYTIVFIFKIQF